MVKLRFAALILIVGVAWGDVTSVITLPGGTNGSVQTNKNGRFNGDSNLTYSTSTHVLSVPAISISTLTAGGLSYTFPTSQTGGYFLQNDGAGGLSWQTPSTFAVSSGTSLAVRDGVVLISSPTSTLNFNASQFIVTLQNATTAVISVDPSSVTLLGQSIDISSNTNLAVSAPITRTGDTIGIDSSSATLLGPSINLTSEVTGTLPAGNLPATIVYTNTTQTIDGVKTFTSSVTVTHPNGIKNTYGIVTGSITAVDAYLTNVAASSGTFSSTLVVRSTFTVESGTTVLRAVPYYWPTTQASGTKILSNDGSGHLTWAADASGTPTLVSSGIAFGSASSSVTQDTNTFVWDPTNYRMTIGTTSSPVTPFSTSAGVRVFSKTSADTRPLTVTNPYRSTYYPFSSNIPLGDFGVGPYFQVSHSSMGLVTLETGITTVGPVSDGAFQFIGGIPGSGGNTFAYMDASQFSMQQSNGGVSASSFTFRGGTDNQFLKLSSSGKNVSSYDLLNATQAWTAQQSWTSNLPSTFTALAVSGLTSGRCVETTNGGRLTVAGAACGSGSGSGVLSLAIATGTSTGFSNPPTSSPTAIVNFNSSQFTSALKGGATAFISLDITSVTLQGQNVIQLTNNFQSGATFYVSSGTVLYNFNVGSSVQASTATFYMPDVTSKFVIASYGNQPTLRSLNALNDTDETMQFTSSDYQFLDSVLGRMGMFTEGDFAFRDAASSNPDAVIDAFEDRTIRSVNWKGLAVRGESKTSPGNASNATGIQGNATGVGTGIKIGLQGLSTALGGTSYGGWFNGTTYGLFVESGQTLMQGSMTVTAADGAGIVYGLNVGSMTGAGLSTCGDGTHAISWNTSGDNKFGCQAITSGGGSASTLAVATGTSAGFSNPPTSSPTAVINFNSSQFNSAFKTGATAYLELNASSVTLLGSSIDLVELPAGVALLASTQTFTGGNTYQGSITSISTMTINNAGTTNAIKITQTGNIGASSSVGGAINLTNTSNTGGALVAYTNQGSPTDNLVNLRVDNVTFSQNALFVDFKGGNTTSITPAVTIRSSVAALGYALNVVGQSTATSTLQLSGQEAAVASFKITHTSPTIVPGVLDTNASAISISLAGAGTQAQGIFLDAASHTSGKLLNLRNSGIEQLVLGGDGNLTEKYGLIGATMTMTAFDTTTTSTTASGASGLRVVYNVDAGSMTGAGLSTCGDATHALAWTSGTNLFSCQAITGTGGGGGASTLAVATGTSAGFQNPPASSPTAVVLLDQSQFSNTLLAGATAFITLRSGISSVSGNFTIGSTSTVVIANCGSACTVTLPTAVGITGRVLTVKIIGTGAASITTTSAQTIDGSTTVTPLPNQYASLDMISDGANWEIE